MESVPDIDPFMIPNHEEREKLFQALAALIQNYGYESLVCAPLLTPTGDFFPDAWSGGRESMVRLVRRLLIYADAAAGQMLQLTKKTRNLSDLTVSIEVDTEGQGQGRSSSVVPGQTVYAWYIGQEKQSLRFGVRPAALEDRFGLVAAFARAVAHAYGEVNQLESSGTKIQAFDIDVMAVYLGFGVLGAATAMHYPPSTGRGPRTPVRLWALSPQMLCFLLALQVCVRELDKASVNSLKKYLPANQLEFFTRSQQWLSHLHHQAWQQRFQIPDSATWPPVKQRVHDEQKFGIDEEQDPSEEKIVSDPGIRDKNRGKPVFRVERSMASRLSKTLGLGTLALGGIFVRSFRSGELSYAYVVIAAVVLGLAGLLLGRLIREARCSDPKCGMQLKPEMSICPLCGGQVRGVISHPKQRLAAEEALQEENR